MQGGAWPLYATTSPQGLGSYEGRGERARRPDLVDRSCGPTEEILRLLRVVASTQAEHQLVVLERLDQLGGRLEAGLAARSPRCGAPREAPREREPSRGRLPRERARGAVSWKRTLSEIGPPEFQDDGHAGDGPKLSYIRSTDISLAAGAEEAHADGDRGTLSSADSTQISGLTQSPRDSVRRRPADRGHVHQLRSHQSEARSATEADGPRRSFWAIGRSTNRNVFMNRLGRHQTMDMEEEPKQKTLRSRCYPTAADSVLSHPTFDVVLGVVISLNSVVIGVELTVQPSEGTETPGSRMVFGAFENLFLSIYVAELVARIYACGQSCLQKIPG
ncbi:unnamed protein product [Prorocentrum cordatum]|uniref:Uncharacterized protein n=1 Tax=Prorocentrum cordatum TaxID=2364126 RepID=A0ABN9UAQ0_9DINO|nr:unnamed protein product [Polarella glacialis]